MNAAQFDRILRQASLLPAAALLVAAAALLLGIRETTSTVRLIEQADQCISQATLVQKLMVDEESGLRGYQVTSDPQFLTPLHNAEMPLAEGFSRLHDLLSGYPKDLADLDTLEAAHNAWHEGFVRPVVATMQGGGKTDDLQLNLLGKNRMDSIRADVDTIVRDSALRRADRITRWRRQTAATLIGILAVSASLGVLLGLYTRGRLRAVSREYNRSQEVLRRRAEELFVSEQNLRTTLASIRDGVITCDAEGRIETMNDTAQEMTGWTLLQAAGSLIHRVFQVIDVQTRSPVDSPATMVQHRHLPIATSRDAILIRRDGAEIIIDNNAAPVRDKSGVMTGIIMVFRDVTDARKTQAALLANEKLAVAGRLAASIAHEIHNPLDSVSNLLYLMSSGSTPEECEHFLDMARQELARVTQISRAMLGLYRESKAPVSISLRETICDLLALMEQRLHTLGVVVTEEVPQDLAVGGFPAELRQVFTNLITNAAEASSAHPNPTVCISASASPAGSEPRGTQRPAGVIIRVVDNGSGIPQHLQDQLFRPFFTTKGEQGTGLGLWVSQGIVRKHGGTIQVESSTAEENHGTAINVFLPAVQPGVEPS